MRIIRLETEEERLCRIKIPLLRTCFVFQVPFLT